MPNKIINVTDIQVSVIDKNGQDYISITDMLKAKDGEFFIDSWLRNRNTVEFLGVWESINNPDFNYVEFDVIKSKAGLNSFKISVKEWVQKTNAIGLTAQAGRYGGTYAHPDIAFEFATWISPAFKLYLIKEFQRLKDVENNSLNIEWNVKRVLSKANYHLHTAAVKDCIIPILNLAKDKEWIAYASEADLLNVAMFGCTAKQWKEANPELAAKGYNIRDIASINQLIVLSNIESFNSIMIRSNMPKKDRLEELARLSKHQLQQFDKLDIEKSYKRVIDDQYNMLATHLPDKKDVTDKKKTPLQLIKDTMNELKDQELSDMNKKLKKALDNNPKEDKNESPG